MSDEPDKTHGNDDGLVRSPGASQQRSPLLSSLLQQTLSDAEKEKRELEAKLKEREAEERRKREAEEATRRAELQKRLEEERRRRDDQLKAAQARDAGPVAEGPVSVQVAPAPKWPLITALVLILAAGGGLYFVYTQIQKDKADALGVAATQVAEANEARKDAEERARQAELARVKAETESKNAAQKAAELDKRLIEERAAALAKSEESARALEAAQKLAASASQAAAAASASASSGSQDASATAPSSGKTGKRPGGPKNEGESKPPVEIRPGGLFDPNKK